MRQELHSGSIEASRLLYVTNAEPRLYPLAERFVQLVREVIPISEAYADAARAKDARRMKTLAESVATSKLDANISDAYYAFQHATRRAQGEASAAIRQQFRELAWLLMISLVLGITLTTTIMFVFGVGTVRRLRQLHENAARLERGEATVALSGNDELADLDRQYHRTALRLRREHAVSTTLQRALLPQRLPQIPGLRVDTAYVPAASDTMIGGDWYDIFELPDGTIGISMGDVAGHGLHAASVMAATRQSIRTAARLAPTPSDVLAVVNRLLCDEEDALVTAFFATLDMQSGKLVYAVAGHPPAITLRASGDTGLLSGYGLILGVDPYVRYDLYETFLEEGSALVLYTDGVVEAVRENYTDGVRNLTGAVQAEYYHSDGNIAEAIHSRVFRTIEPHDDSAIVFIGVMELGATRASLRKTWTIDATSVTAARQVKRALLWQLGRSVVGEADLGAVELIYGELVGNVARHTDGYAEITLEFRGDAAVLHVLDRGAPIPAVHERAKDLEESGRGLFIVETLARELRIERVAGGNRISATFPLTLIQRRELETSPEARALLPYVS
jgi:serine phosphatase RsbU (regulator of sigma subunit)/anti-sigma regulatory factor (Ser/Thr protein kinase)